MVSASFKYSNFDINCSENNVSIAPIVISDHFSDINQIAPIGAQVSRDAGAAQASCAEGIALPRGNKRRTAMSATLSKLFQPAVTVRPGRYLRRLFHAWAGDIAHYFGRRAALQRLGELNDRELRDIGLSRDQVEAAVYGFIARPDRARI
jgi:uncharacterized protein YjiS (DUF1127 family)